jgi:Gpi18-like mannosyltransferase
LLLLTYFAMLFSTAATGSNTHLVGTAPHRTFTPGALLLSWYRWDAAYFGQIATTGYSKPQDVAFFPLFPLQIRLIMLPLGTAHPVAAALLAANADALLAFIALGLLATRELGPGSVRSVVLVAAAYPLAFFTMTAYSDALFLALAVMTMLAARRGAWVGAGLCAGLAGLTRPTAVVLVLPLLWEYGQQQAWWQGRRRNLLQQQVLARLALLASAAPVGIALYAGYLGLRFDHPLLFVHVQSQYWSRVSMPLWRSIPLAIAAFFAMPAGTYEQARLLVDLGPLVVCTLVTLATIRRIPVAYTLYLVGLLYVCVATPVHNPTRYDSDLFVSSGRFLLAAFPLYLVLARWTRTRRWLEMVLMGGGFGLQAILLSFFLSGGWLV